MTAQSNLRFPYSAAALVALDAIVESLDGGPAPGLSSEVFDELDARGDIDAWDALQRSHEADHELDWADPDGAELDTPPLVRHVR